MRSSTEHPPSTHEVPPATRGTGGDISRRELVKMIFWRGLAVATTLNVVKEVGGGQAVKEMLSKGEESISKDSIPETEALEMLEEAEEKLHTEAEKAIAHIEAEYPGLSEREKAMKTIDYLGCAVFATGVGSLLTGGHIAALHYGMFSAVMAAKYSLSNEQERHHLMAEFHSSAKAGMIIAGTVVLAEGIKGDLDKAYGKIAERSLTNTDRTALLTMLSGVVSPIVTTVGSATLAKDMAKELASGNMDKAAVLMQYVSNSSGFLLFGDPPFIAVCEKYGFTEGVKWQAQTMWPMALYSLFSSAYKINFLRAEEEAGEESKSAWALRETIKGFRTNLPVLATIIKASLKNTAKFYSGQDLRDGVDQAEEGLQFDIDNVLAEKWSGVVNLFKGQIDSSTHHEDAEGLHGDSEREKGIKELMKGVFLECLSGRQQEDIQNLNRAIDDLDFERINTISKNLGIDIQTITPMLIQARKMLEAHTPKDQQEASRPWYVQAWDYTNYLTDLNNVKGAIGHNLGDIVDVFPFQAGCVPFLATAFKDVQQGISNMLNREEISALLPSGTSKERAMEACMFFLIMGFSSIADNYVACKIGLELFPEKPEVALVPSVIGGGMSSVGNMANLALFNLEQMPLATSFAKDYWHIDIAAFGLLWTQILRNLQGEMPFNLLFGEGIKPKAQVAH